MHRSVSDQAETSIDKPPQMRLILDLHKLEPCYNQSKGCDTRGRADFEAFGPTNGLALALCSRTRTRTFRSWYLQHQITKQMRRSRRW